MERKEYLSRMERYADRSDARGIMLHYNDVLVTWKGLLAYPYRYLLGYTTRPKLNMVVGGRVVTQHFAVLRLVDTLTELTVPLAEVQAYQANGGENNANG